MNERTVVLLPTYEEAANLEAMRTRGNPAGRKDRKLRLAKGLLQRNWSADDIRELLRLIDWLMTLPEDLEGDFQNEFHVYEKESNVAYVTSFERSGIKKGQLEGLLEGIELALDLKFKAKGRKLLPKVAGIRDIAELRDFGQFLKKAETLGEVREYLSRTSE